MVTGTETHSTSTLKWPQIAVLLAAALQVLTPLLPQLGIGEPIGSRSDAVRTLITPSGWAFSIWGALYAGSVLFAIYQALPAQHDNVFLDRIRWPAAGAFLGNAVWAAYTQTFGLSVVSVAIIVWTLACLLVIYRTFSTATFTTGERWFAFVPLSALTAWLTVATTVNIAASLRHHGVEGGAAAPAIGAAIVVLSGIIAAVALARGRGNLPFAAVFLWAFVAIFSAGGQVAELIAAATAAAGILVACGLLTGLRRPHSSGTAKG
ncbi:hypothetical protein ABVV53_12865 [Novosphingobium sp. RD2P27]|uniref:Tryptophan-rich sensory protein n=1 Tax=Novosphingobium kalidii TaxID=3230299 RepID=A0ABV2D3A9_9SPHN